MEKGMDLCVRSGMGMTVVGMAGGDNAEIWCEDIEGMTFVEIVVGVDKCHPHAAV